MRRSGSSRRLATLSSSRFNKAAGRAFCTTKQTIAVPATSIPAAGISQFYRLDVTALPQWTSLSSLYDLVRVRKVKMTFVPDFNVNQVGTAGSVLPLLHTAIDHEALTAAPKTTAQLQEYSVYRFERWDKPIERLFVPAYSLTTTGGGSQPQYAQWMSTEAMTSTNLGAGIYYNCDPVASVSPAPTYRVIIEVFLEFKSMN